MLIFLSRTEYAGVMELADVPDSKSGGGNTVRVRPPPPAPKVSRSYGTGNFLSKPQAWHIITRQRVYHQRRLAAFVSHHAVGVHKKLLRLDDIQPYRADEKQHFVLMRYKASP